MADYSPILNLPQVSPNQTQKETTINTAMAILEAASNDMLGVSLAAGDVTLNTDQFTKYFLFEFSGHTTARTVTVPATPRWFAIENLGTATVTVKTPTGGSSGGSLVAELAAGKIGLVISDGTDLRFVVPDPSSGTGLLEDLSNVTGVPTNGQLLRWVAADGNWEPWTLAFSFLNLSDTPGSYSAGKLVAVNAAGNGIEFVDSSANVNSFTDLDDTPSSYSGAAGRTLKVNTGGTAVIFAQPKLTEASDFPSSYSGATGKFLRVNNSANAVSFDVVTIDDISDGPGSPATGDELKYVRVKSDGSGLEYASGTGGPDQFYQLGDTPSSYTGQAKKVVRVNTSEDGVEFHAPAFSDNADVPAYTGNGGKFAQVNSTVDGLQFGLPKVSDLSDGPGAPTSNALKVVRVNLGATALEYVSLAITDLSGFPSSFTGAGGKFLQVKPDGTGIQFVSSSYTTNFLALTDSPSSYSGQAGAFIAVDPTSTGLIFKKVVIPVKLGDLADVEDGTGTPSQGNYLRYIDGVWQADPGQAGGATALSGLSDVDTTTTPPTDQQALIYDQATGKWVPGDVASGGGGGGSATSLGELSDVDLSTGTPNEGDVLTYHNGIWNAEPGGSAYDFIDLADTPGSYSSQAGRALRVKSTEDGVEFYTIHDIRNRGAWGSSVEYITANFDSGVPAEFAAATTAGWTVVSDADSGASTSSALKSAAIGNSAATSFAFSVDGDPDGTSTLNIRYRVSSEGGFDYFRVYVDGGSPVYSDSGNTGAYEASTAISIPSGTHSVSFEYSKDGSNAVGSDCVFISQVIYPKTITDPYVQGNVVTYSGKTYLCLVDNTTDTPGTSADWVEFGAGAGGTGGATELAQLTDVDLSTGTPAQGDVLTYDAVAGVWTAEAPSGGSGGSGGGTTRVSARHWRLRLVTGVDTHNGWGLAELKWLDASASNLVGSGTPSASQTSSSGTWSVTAAFDGSTGVNNGWYSDSDATGVGSWLSYDFGSSVTPVQVSFAGLNTYAWTTGITLAVDYSDDGVAWNQLCLLNTTTAVDDTYQTYDIPLLAVGSGGATSLSELSDVDFSTAVPSDGDILVYKAGAATWEPETPSKPADFSVFVSGAPTDSELLLRLEAAFAFTLSNSGHVGSSGVSATSSAVFTLKKNGSSIGTVSFSSSGSTASFSVTQTAFASGDILTLYAPSSADITLADLSFTFRASR